jgi:hypothetical protein
MDDNGSVLRVGKRSSLLRCFGQFFSYVICFYENLFTVNYFWQNKVVLTYGEIGHPSCLPLFLHQVKMFFQYIPNEVSYVYNEHRIVYDNS